MDLQPPPSVEGSAKPDDRSQTSDGGSQAHYRSSDEECFQCKFFQDPSTCSKGVNGGQTEPGAGCDLFELKGDGSNDADDQGGAPMPGQGAPPQGQPQGQ